MRLTEKDGSYKEYQLSSDLQTIIGIKEWNNSLTQKLCQLEDIEEENKFYVPIGTINVSYSL